MGMVKSSITKSLYGNSPTNALPGIYYFLLFLMLFCIASLIAKKVDNEWIIATKRWTLVAWGFLTAGITLGWDTGHTLSLDGEVFWAWDSCGEFFFPTLV